MASPRLKLLVTAAVFHLIYFYSIFDIYFVSPIVSGMQLFQSQTEGSNAPAQRLVLFVGDGLRADKAFEPFPESYAGVRGGSHPAPFLRSRVLEHGTFGISHTRVPTESRPGHVALIAGLYEDVSAVATGWKLNPVNFDSVFNRSRHTWSWGSPDILPMFEKGASPGVIDAYCYDPSFEDNSQDPVNLDLWVFDHVTRFFEEAKTNRTLNDMLRKDKIVFFLHLLGLDSTGHSYRPYSDEYLRNLQVVDQGVKKISALIENFYKDDQTAFVFTADHGMSDWGSHGDGHPDNTRTPLVAWGSGVAKPRKIKGSRNGHDSYSAAWNFGDVQRNDVAQADIAALMAYLVGLEFPANSVGELPLPFLSAEKSKQAAAYQANAKGILEQYHVKESIKQNTTLRYEPFEPLGAGKSEGRLDVITRLIEQGSPEAAIKETKDLIEITLQGLRYMQTYDWLFLRALVTAGYIGWMMTAVGTVLELFVLEGRVQTSRTWQGIIAFSSILVLFFSSFVISRSPSTYYAYATFAVYFWNEAYARRHVFFAGGKQLIGPTNSTARITSLSISAVLYVGILGALALAYIYREILTGLFIIGAVYPLSYGKRFVSQNATLTTAWFILCVIMSSFTLLSALKLENVGLILTSGLLILGTATLYLTFEDRLLRSWTAKQSTNQVRQRSYVSRLLMFIQVGLVVLAIYVTRSSALSLQAKKGLPPGNQVLGWAALIISLCPLPLLHQLQKQEHHLHRLMSVFLTFAPTFIILTISYESMFYWAYFLTLVTWIELESRIQNFTDASSKLKRTSSMRPLTLSDTRVALFGFFLIQSAFFSTGNVASVSSFSLESVYRLVPIFDPFAQGALLVLKLLIPFVLVSGSLAIVNQRLGLQPYALFVVSMALTDVLTLYFFWNVRDSGSWLEIGSTISHFAITSLMCVFVAGLGSLGGMFVTEVDETKAVGAEKAQNGRK